MIKAVIFDYGGVVIPLTNARGDIAAAYGLKQEDLEPVIEPFVDLFGRGYINETQFWAKLSDALHLPIPDNAFSLWGKSQLKWTFYWPVIQLINNLRRQHIMTFVLSNTIPPHVDHTRLNGGFDFFDQVFLSCEIGLRKPDPKIYRYVLKEIHLPGPQCLYIDDIPENLLPAKTLGMRTVLAKNPFQVVRDVHQIIKPKS